MKIHLHVYILSSFSEINCFDIIFIESKSLIVSKLIWRKVKVFFKISGLFRKDLFSPNIIDTVMII